MRNRRAEGTLALGALDIDMDPLTIAGACREPIDAVLIDCNPFGHAQVAADALRRRGQAVLRDRCLVGGCHGVPLWQRAQILAQDFTDIRLRQGAQEPHVFGDLVRRELPPAMGDHVRLAQCRARSLGHE
jgi:hypothetical protein